MQVAEVIYKTRLDNWAVVQTLTNTDLVLGSTFTLTDVGSELDGEYTVYALPQYLYVGTDAYGNHTFNPNVPVPNQVMYRNEGDLLSRVEVLPAGSLEYNPYCDWTNWEDIAAWLGIGVATQADEDFLVTCASAANDFVFQRRLEAGYTDNPAVVPSPKVFLGTVQYGAMIYRQRGSIDTYSSFGDGGGMPVVGLSGAIKQLLGIDRPVCA